MSIMDNWMNSVDRSDSRFDTFIPYTPPPVGKRADELLVSKYLKRGHFRCKCGCKFGAVDITLVQIIEYLSNEAGFGRPKITSGCRCDKRNVGEGGRSDSFHKLGMAVDVSFSKSSPIDWLHALQISEYWPIIDVVPYIKKNIIHIEIDDNK